MKHLYKKIFLIVWYAQNIYGNTINIVNSTGALVTVTLKTIGQTITVSAKPDENHFLNDINNPEATYTRLEYENSPIDSITIIRLSTTMPQIIYYNNETLMNHEKKSSGLFDLNNSGQGTLQIWQDKVQINNALYNLLDISSMIGRCNLLKNSLTMNNISSIEKSIEDLNASIKLMQESDKISGLGAQIALTQTAIMILSSQVAIMKTLQTMIESLANLQNHLNDDNANETDQQLQGLAIGLRTVETAHALQNMQDGSKTMEASLQNISPSTNQQGIYHQIQQVKNGIHKLRLALQQKQNYQTTINPEELISSRQQLNDEIAINNQQAMNNIGIGYNN